MKNVNTGTLLLHYVEAMAVIFIILALAVKVVRKRSGLPTSLKGGVKANQIRVITRQSMGKGVFIAMIQVEGKDLLVGITPHSVNVLAEMDLGVESDESLPVTVSSSVPSGGSSRNSSLGGQWTTSPNRGASPIQAWMSKLDQLREATVRRS